MHTHPLSIFVCTVVVMSSLQKLLISFNGLLALLRALYTSLVRLGSIWLLYVWNYLRCMSLRYVHPISSCSDSWAEHEQLGWRMHRCRIRSWQWGLSHVMPYGMPHLLKILQLRNLHEFAWSACDHAERLAVLQGQIAHDSNLIEHLVLWRDGEWEGERVQIPELPAKLPAELPASPSLVYHRTS